MDEFFGAIAIGVITVLCAFGAVFLSSDVRHFKQVVAECREQGYIQNDKIRVLCKLEENK